jgi:hypothetical protein
LWIPLKEEIGGIGKEAQREGQDRVALGITLLNESNLTLCCTAQTLGGKAFTFYKSMTFILSTTLKKNVTLQ